MSAASQLAPRALRNRVLGTCGAKGALPPESASTVRFGHLPSAHQQPDPQWSIAWPAGLQPGQPAPVCVCLHGRGGSHRTAISSLRFHDFVAAAGGAGIAPFAVASIDGGDRYWHHRADGSDPLAAVLDEFLPFLSAEHNLGGKRATTAILGWSMGGFGALLAAEAAPERFAAAVATGPAIGRTRTAMVGDAFDSDADFAAHDVFAGASQLRDVSVRIDCGRGDPYFEAARDFARSLPSPPETDFPKGCHDVDYWRRVAPAQVRFLARAFAGGGSKA